MFELTRSLWSKEDGVLFVAYLETLGQPEKQQWAKSILNTPSEVLAIPTKTIGEVGKRIAKGNYRGFLDLKITNYYETIALYGSLLSKLTNFQELKYYLTEYLDMMDNWAHCDLLSFPTIFEDIEAFLTLSKAYLVDERVFVRRLGLFILFLLVKDETYLPLIFDAIKQLENEEAYYVIMMGGWLLSECIILHQEKTLLFLDHHSINRKIQNKAIQKCRESRRLTQELKDFLLAYKVKK